MASATRQKDSKPDLDQALQGGTALQAPPKATLTQQHLAGLPEQLRLTMLQDTGAGMENAQAKDYALPFLALAQQLTPQVDPDNMAYIEGLMPGMVFNTVTGEILADLRAGGRLTFIPCHFESRVIEWVKKDAGGGFIAAYATRAEAELNKRDDPNTQLVDTANHYVLVYSPKQQGWVGAILSCTSTKLRTSRRLMSRVAERTVPSPEGPRMLPSFAGQYAITGVKESKKGNTYWTYGLVMLEGAEGWVTDPALYQQAKAFYQQVAGGQKGADYQHLGSDIVQGEEDEGEPKY